ncbi:MAG: hypothetical protein JWP30_162 [Homoserinimonas sp.]|nr:hypothetical protein [Homoserinimonas sp.]
MAVQALPNRIQNTHPRVDAPQAQRRSRGWERAQLDLRMTGSEICAWHLDFYSPASLCSRHRGSNSEFHGQHGDNVRQVFRVDRRNLCEQCNFAFSGCVLYSVRYVIHCVPCFYLR